MNLDFSKLATSIQYFIIGIIVLMPIFYFDLYLFHKSFFSTTSLDVRIIAAYCLAFGWLVVSMFIGLTFQQYTTSKKNVEVEDMVGFGNGVAFLLIAIAHFGIFIGHKSDRNLDVYIEQLIVSVVASLGVVTFRAWWIKRKLKKNKQLEIPFTE